MSARWWDGFDYGALADLSKVYGSAAVAAHATLNATAGRLGGAALVHDANAANNALLNFPAAIFGSAAANSANYVGFGSWIKIPSAPATNQALAICYNLASVAQCQLFALTSGLLGHFNGSSVVETGLTNVCDNAWHWIEWRFKMATGNATLVAYVDNVVQWNQSAVGALGNGSWLQLLGMNGKANVWDDVLVYEDDGGAVPNIAQFPVGPQVCLTKRVTSDAAVSFATSTGASHYTELDEVSCNTADYVRDFLSGAQDLFGLSALGYSPASILGAGGKVISSNPGVGNVSLRQCCKSGVTQANGATITVPLVTPLGKAEFFPTDPATGLAWGITGLDAANFGFNIP